MPVPGTTAALRAAVGEEPPSLQSRAMDPLYQPEGVEQSWQRTWEEQGLYRAGAAATRDEAFSIALPPPNVTGSLHMGHALNGSIQDVLVRWHRMRGFDTLWQPGYDHASISVHAVIERQLLQEGTNRFELGRDAFVERTWRWLEEYGGIIMGQLRRLGASLDYTRERFTMDEASSSASMVPSARLACRSRAELNSSRELLRWTRSMRPVMALIRSTTPTSSSPPAHA